LAVFEAVDELRDGESVNEVSALVSRTMQGLNSEERYRLPDLVRQALKESGHSNRF
jgi:hypothetical protein